MVPDNSNRNVFLRDANGFSSSFRDSRSAQQSNGREFQESELIDLLRRAMAGDGYPLSGGPEVGPVQDNKAPLTSRIRGILQSDPATAAATPKAASRPVYESLIPADKPLPPKSPAKPVAMPVAETQAIPPLRAARPAAELHVAAPVTWSPSFRAIGFVVLAALVGGSIPALMAPAPEYSAEASLKLAGGPSAPTGLLDMTASRVASSHVLSQAVVKLKLESNPEFNGGGATAYGVAKDIFTDTGGASDNLSRAQDALRERLSVAREPQTGTVRLSVRTGDAPQSIRIVNLLAQIAASDAAHSPDGGAIASQSDASHKAYDDATAALDDFKAKVGEDKIDAALKLQQQKQDMDRQLDSALAEAQSATIRLAAAKAVKVQDVLSGSISPDLGSPAALEDLRNRYASAKSALTMLATQLGPRHPRLLAQQATVDSLSGSIMSEIQKLVGENDNALKRANDQLKQLRNQAAGLDTDTSGVDMAQLKTLQDAVENARATYENELSAPALLSSPAQTAPLALVSPATQAPAVADGSIVLNEMYGFLSGAAIAFGMVVIRMFLRNVLSRPVERYQPEQKRRHVDTGMPLHPAPEAPQMRFDSEMPVANDRPVSRPVVQPTAPLPRPVDPGVTAARQSVASLRARVETYAAQRSTRR